MTARERAIRAHRMLLSGGGKLSYFEEWGVSLETVRAAWLAYEVTSGDSPLHRWGRFRGLCSKHDLVDLESMLQECVGIKPYSEDLRVRIVKAVQEGMSKSAAARLFGVSLSSVKRYARTLNGASPLCREGRWQTAQGG